MRFFQPRAVVAALALFGLAACESPLVPVVATSARLAPVLEAKVCADPMDPICAVFSSTVYEFNPALGALPPGVSDWRIIITQFGGQLDFLGAVSHGGAPITNIENMYVRFFIDNGDATFGAGDLQVVVRNTPTGAQLHCGLVTSLPVGPALPSASPAICENGGTSINEPGRLIFDSYRTADLSAPLWESQGFARLRADERRALFLVEVGNVTLVGGSPVLGPPTAPATRVDTLNVSTGGNNGGGNNGGGNNGGGDTGGDGDDETAPTIQFASDKQVYSILDNVRVTCAASDNGSGLLSSVCPAFEVPAYTLPMGWTTLTATAEDYAGNVSELEMSFRVFATRADLCTLARRLARNNGMGNSLCATLSSGTRAFTNLVRAQSGKGLSAADAASLLAIAESLDSHGGHGHNDRDECDRDRHRDRYHHRSYKRDRGHHDARDRDNRGNDRDDRNGNGNGNSNGNGKSNGNNNGNGNGNRRP